MQGVSGEFLVIDPSARQNGLGTAYVGMADDSSSLFINPAGLGIIDRFQFMVSQYSKDMGEQLNSASFVYPFGKSSIGIHGTILHYAFAQNFKLWNAGSEINNFNIYSYSAGIGYGMMIRKDLAVGVSGKYIKETILDYSTKTIGFDVGALFEYQIPLPFVNQEKKKDAIVLSRFKKNLRLGMSFQNIGGKIKYTDKGEGDSLPIKFNTGFSFMPFPFIGLTYQFSSLITDSLGHVDNTGTSSFGMELFRNYYVIPRLGYSIKHSGETPGNIFMGAGFKIDYFGLFYELDYVYRINRASEDLNNNHILSFTMGTSPAKMIWIRLSSIDYDPSLYLPEDNFIKREEMEFIQDKQKLKYTPLNGYMNKFVARDNISLNKELHKRMEKLILSEYPERHFVELVSTKERAETQIQCEIFVQNETIQAKLTHSLLNGTKAFYTNISISYISDPAEPPVGSVVLMNKKGKIEVKAEKSDIKQQVIQNSLLKELAVNIIQWIAASGKDLIAAEVLVTTGVEDVDIYVDRFLEGKTDDKGRVKIKVLPGKHSISARKMNYSKEEKEIETIKGQKLTINMPIKKGFFYSDLIVNSYPSEADVYINNRLEGKTPLIKERLVNSVYTIRVEKGGKQFEEKVEINKWGYNVIKNYVFDYDSTSSKQADKLWSLLDKEKGIKPAISETSYILEGTSQDDSINGSGFVSKEFTAGDLEAGFDVANVHLDDGILMVGLMDQAGNKVFINFDGRYFAVRKVLRNDERLFVKALDKGKKDKFKLVLKYYDKLNEIEAIVDDSILDTIPMEFNKNIKALLFLDADSSDRKQECRIERIWIK